jgi:hypothetical protein
MEKTGLEPTAGAAQPLGWLCAAGLRALSKGF